VLSNSVKWQKARCDPVPVPLQLDYRSYLHMCYCIVGDSPGLRLSTEVLNVDVVVVQVIDQNDNMWVVVMSIHVVCVVFDFSLKFNVLNPILTNIQF
jgi:hypothetical protein